MMNTLRKGSIGDSVKTLQRLLGITADGKFGKGTKAAVIAYQQKHGLAADGVVGPATWASLLNAGPVLGVRPPDKTSSMIRAGRTSSIPPTATSRRRSRRPAAVRRP